tara:strand:+ start:2001 stop:2525 length:525 start_codon:yes stop_codon:yes gene_type:complete
MASEEINKLKKEIEHIHSIKSKGAGEKEELVLGQHYPPGVIGMKNLVKCWEYNLGYRKKYEILKDELEVASSIADLTNATNQENNKLREENKKLEKEIKDWRVNFNEERQEHKKLKDEIDTTFECTGYGDDIIQDGYTKLDAIHEWATGACECFREEIERLEEENKKLKDKVKD